MSTCGSNESTCSDTKTYTTDSEVRATIQLNTGNVQNGVDISSTTDDRNYDDAIIKVPLLITGREKRNISPASSILNEVFTDPHSPSSSSSTSQTTSANDVTFEPTIEMMVNDFDDEQTLNEEEALASFDSQDPEEEIDTLKKESEMPLDELLAKYRDLPPLPSPNICSEPTRKKQKKSLQKEKQKQKYKQEFSSAQTCSITNEGTPTSGKIANISRDVQGSVKYLSAESDHINSRLGEENIDENNSNNISIPRNSFVAFSDNGKEFTDNSILQNEVPKVRRSHLLALYPQGTFDNIVAISDSIASNCEETIYGVQEDEEDEEIEEEDEDYKKKVMIGTLYQATIPTGLSQYGDILPYENEDKLIWEPCQVSEREVEEYLIKIRDIKSNQQGEEDESAADINSEDQSIENGISEENIHLENNVFSSNGDKILVEVAAPMDIDNQTVVKDNEQALHLLVQCGYDFKEALRRKRLNALPLNDCMSLWSEEECHKFEEGIQKYGKDFLKIRQTQVRTRTMRELVQFYYLWKKSERRDQNFANADTVDHMDIYLNEENEYGSNTSSALTPLGSPVGNTSTCSGTGRNYNVPQKNISIMTTISNTPAVTNLTPDKNSSKTYSQQQQPHHKRRTHICNQSTLNVMASDHNSENSSNTLSSSNV